jgi:hypothetical protein
MNDDDEGSGGLAVVLEDDDVLNDDVQADPVRPMRRKAFAQESPSSSLIAAAMRFEHVPRRSLTDEASGDGEDRVQRFLRAQDRLFSFFRRGPDSEAHALDL